MKVIIARVNISAQTNRAKKKTLNKPNHVQFFLAVSLTLRNKLKRWLLSSLGRSDYIRKKTVPSALINQVQFLLLRASWPSKPLGHAELVNNEI